MIEKKLVINGVEDISIVSESLNIDTMTPTQSLIKTKASLISAGTELSRVYGLKEGATYPVYPGYCSVGEVLSSGDQVTDVSKGDVVLFSGPHSSVQLYDREVSDGGILFKLNDKTSVQDGAFLMMCSIAMNGILPVDVKLGDTAVIIGMGTLGLINAILYKQMGVKVIAVEPVHHRAETARKAGIENVISTTTDHQQEAVMKALNYEGANIVVDATGLSVCIEMAIEIAAVHGQVVLLGSPREVYNTNISKSFNSIHMKMLNVIGALNRRFPYYETEGSRLSLVRNLKYLETLLNNKVIDSDLFISHTIKADEVEIMKAYKGLMYDKENYTGVLIDWE